MCDFYQERVYVLKNCPNFQQLLLDLRVVGCSSIPEEGNDLSLLGKPYIRPIGSVDVGRMTVELEEFSALSLDRCVVTQYSR
jgi:hypothetical protein